MIAMTALTKVLILTSIMRVFQNDVFFINASPTLIPHSFRVRDGKPGDIYRLPNLIVL